METDGGVAVPPPVRPPSALGRALVALRRRLPVLESLQRYSRGTAAGDVVAGLTLGLTLVPQSIAYAALAGIPVQRGLYSALAGGVVYAALGSVPQVSIGPTSLMALLTLHTCHALPAPYVSLFAFLAGAVVLLMGLLRLGFLVDLISPGATGGFTSGAALIVALAQVKGLLGLSFAAESVGDNVRMAALQWRRVRLPDCGLSAGCIALLLALRKLKDAKVSPKRRVLQRALWLISISRNALVVAGAATLAYLTRDVNQPQHPWFKLSGRVESGLPALQWPAPLWLPAPTGNGTVSLPEAAGELGGALLLTPLVMVLANIAIAKAFARGRVDATQEMVALGMCNVLGACLQAMPTCGAFTRSAVSHASGVRTPIAGLYSGAITLLALVFLTEYFYYIPRASLSAVLVCAVIFMVDTSFPVQLWRRGERMETAAWAATVGGCVLLGVEPALLLGGGLSLAGLLRRLLRDTRPPRLHKSPLGPVLVVRAPPALVYLNVARWAEHAAATAGRCQATVLLVHCGDLALVDDAATQELQHLSKQLSERGTQLAAFAAHGSAADRLSRQPTLPVACLRVRSLPEALTALATPPQLQPTLLDVGPDNVPLLTINTRRTSLT